MKQYNLFSLKSMKFPASLSVFALLRVLLFSLTVSHCGLLHSTRSTLGYPQWLTVRENNNTRRRAKTESEAGNFMDFKENKLYCFIQLELLRPKHLTKSFGEEQSPRY